MTSLVDNNVYHDKDVFLNTLKTGGIFTGIGFFVSAVRNALATDKAGALGVFTRTGSTITQFAAVGSVFAATEAITANSRKTDDWINSAVAGCAAGLVPGLRAHSYSLMCGGCLSLAATMALVEYTGSLKGVLYGKTKEEQRQWRRRLIATKE